MASSPLVLPGVLFVGEDERQRLTAHTGPAAGWMTPKGILQWSTEVSVVPREALTEEVRRETKLVMPEEQIPPAKYPLTAEAAKRSPLVAVSSKLTSKLVEQGVRVHTVGVDRMTSSFFYIAEGGTEDPMTVSGDLVQAVAEMLGERADNAAIERAMDSIVDRLLRSLSKDRVTELGVELAASLPRAANDGSGAQGIDLDQFEKDLAALVGSSEKYAAHLQEVADKILGSTERKVDVPLYVDARKVPQGPFDLTVGDRKVPLGTYERWVMSGPFTEPGAAAPKQAAAPAKTEAKAEAKPAPSPKPAEAKPKPTPSPKPAEAKPAPSPKPAEAKPSPTPAPAKAAALAAPIAPNKTSDRPPAPRPATKSRPDIEAQPQAKAEPAPIQPQAVVSVGGSAEPVSEKKPEPEKTEEPKAAEPAAEKVAQKTLPLSSATFDPSVLEKKEPEEKPAAAPMNKTLPLSAVDPGAAAQVAQAQAAAEKAKSEPKIEAKSDAKTEPKAEPAKEEKAEKKAEAKDLAKDEKKKEIEKKEPPKGGFPWLIVLIAIALAIVIYQVVLSKK